MSSAFTTSSSASRRKNNQPKPHLSLVIKKKDNIQRHLYQAQKAIDRIEKAIQNAPKLPSGQPIKVEKELRIYYRICKLKCLV